MRVIFGRSVDSKIEFQRFEKSGRSYVRSQRVFHCLSDCGPLVGAQRKGFKKTQEIAQHGRGQLRPRLAGQGRRQTKDIRTVLGDVFGINPFALRFAAVEVQPGVSLERDEHCGIGDTKPRAIVLMGSYKVVIILLQQNGREAVVVGVHKDRHHFPWRKVQSFLASAEEFDLRWELRVIPSLQDNPTANFSQ